MAEADQLIQAAKQSGDMGNAMLLLLLYRHGFRVSEAIALLWEQVNLKQGTLHVKVRYVMMQSQTPLLTR